MSKDVNLADTIKMHAPSDLKGWDKNPRRNDHAVDAIAASIQRYGMNVPILINRQKQVIAGNTRLKACQKLGIERVPCIVASHLNAQQQQAFNVADNKLGEIASWDDTLLDQIFEQQQDLLGDAFEPEALGFSQAEIDHIVNGWSGDGTIDKIEETGESAPARLVVTGPAEYKDAVRQVIESALQQEGLADHGYVVK